MAPAPPRPRVLVAGGSIGGLTTALVLRGLGCEVDVFERAAADLEDRGAGIVVLPITERWFEERPTGHHRVSLPLDWWAYVDATGAVVDRRRASLRFSGWSTVYRALLDAFGRDRYHAGRAVTGFAQDGAGVTLVLDDGSTVEGGLLVFADGTASTGRSILVPEVRPAYTGYVAWRGTTPAAALSGGARHLLADAMVYQVLSPGHILVYAIPDRLGRTDPQHRVVNFVWYRNSTPDELDDLMTDDHGRIHHGTMPPGSIRACHLAEMRAAARDLAPVMHQVVLGCDQPLIQGVFELHSRRMAFGRVCLIGDAATTLRPHIAAGQAKACADAWALGDALDAAGGDVPASLDRWEPVQVELARRAFERSAAMGRASQFEGTMVPGDPSWTFGLWEPGN